ncbi:MAG: arylesterase [Gemmatimonadota bacterium]
MGWTDVLSGSVLVVSLLLSASAISGCGEENPRNSGPIPEGASASPEGAQSDAIAARGDSPRGTEGGTQDEDASGEFGDSRDSRPAILFFGTSLTAGYGLDDRQDAFPAFIQEKVEAAGLDFRVVNAGVPGETSAAGLRRIGWILDRTAVEFIVLELGANDGLRGQDPNALRENLQAAIDSTRAHEPDATIVLAGMEAPPNLGPRYTEEFRRVFQEVSSRNDAILIPFLLDGVAGVPELNQADRIHPTEEGHRIIAENVWEALQPLLASG